MKTTIIRTIEKAFQGAVLVSLSALFLHTTASAQHKEVPLPDQSTTTASGKLQANIFPSLDPLILKIVFVNPMRELVTLTVRNAEKETVYRKVISPTQKYNSKLNVSGLPDGKYTFEVSAKSKRFSQSFEIVTHTARLTHVQ